MRALAKTLAAAVTLGALSIGQEPVIRISVTLVQVDAVVTDQKGRAVTDLKADDFEILQDGKPQKITHFSYVAAVARPAASPAPPPRSKKQPPAVPGPPRRVRPGDVRRTIALVVDDLGLSFESVASVRGALKKFVEEQLQPGDLAAIVRTGAGTGTLQAFTTDKRLLQAAIERIRWNPLGRGGVSAFPPIRSEPQAPGLEETEGDTRPIGAEEEDFLTEYYSVGTLGALNYIVQGLRELPGRKSVVLLSDNLRIFNREGSHDRVFDALERLVDLANRSAVVIYTVDPRGLPTLALTAADDPGGLRDSRLLARMEQRRMQYFDSQDGLNYLAVQTGGLFLHSTNDIPAALEKVLQDQQGYYLLGYNPGDATFDRAFHKIRVRVKKPGLTVRSRSGFLGVPDEEARPRPRTRQEQLLAALASPFGATGVHLRLTSLFANSSKIGSYVYSLLHIDCRDLSFSDEPDGWKSANLDVVVTTYGDSGVEMDRSDRTYTIRVRGNTYQTALQNGLVYTIHHKVKKTGAYQLRAAVRDVRSGRVGSASQFIEVPDLGKGRLALSGLFVRDVGSAKKGVVDPERAQEGAEEEQDPQGHPGVRLFRTGREIAYVFQIFNARQNPSTRLPELETRIAVYRDGQKVYEGPQRPYKPNPEADPKRLLAGGGLRLGASLVPGEYVMQVTVRDRLAKPQYQTAAQWIDFQITP